MLPTISWIELSPCTLAKETTEEKMQKESTACVLVLDWCSNVQDIYCDHLESLR